MYNDPVNFVDPLGLDGVDAQAAGLFPASPLDPYDWRNEFRRAVRDSGESFDDLLQVAIDQPDSPFEYLTEEESRRVAEASVTPGHAPGYLLPVAGATRSDITSFFNPGWPPVGTPSGETGIGHWGTDFGFPEGTEVRAAREGTVVRSELRPFTFGQLIEIQHNTNFGVESTRSAHLSERLVGENDIVKIGQPIGRIGDTGLARGAHLHFEIRKPTTPSRNLGPEGQLDAEGRLLW